MKQRGIISVSMLVYYLSGQGRGKQDWKQGIWNKCKHGSLVW